MLSQDKDGWNKLHFAARDNRIDEAKKMMKEAKKINIVSELVNNVGNHGWTPLYWASDSGHLQMVKLFITNGAEIDKANIVGWTPLMVASLSGHLEVVKLLIEHQADVHLKDDDGETALYWARERGKTAIEKALLEAGAK